MKRLIRIMYHDQLNKMNLISSPLNKKLKWPLLKSVVVTGNKALERFKKNNFDIKVSLTKTLDINGLIEQKTKLKVKIN